MDTHLNDDIIFQYISEEVSLESNKEIENHIEECDSCFEKLRSLLYLKENFQDIWQTLSFESILKIEQQLLVGEKSDETSVDVLSANPQSKVSTLKHKQIRENITNKLKPLLSFDRNIRTYLFAAAAVLLVIIGNFTINVFNTYKTYDKWVKSGIIAEGVDLNSSVGTAELKEILSRLAGSDVSAAIPASSGLKVADGANVIETAFKLEHEDRDEITKGLIENSPLTYKSALKLIDNFAGDLYSTQPVKPGKYHNLAMNTSGTLLSDTEITGNLILMQGIGEGEVTLHNVKVSGKVYVLGGGMGSVIFENTSTAKVIVNKDNGRVRVFAKQGTVIDHIALGSGAKLQSESTSNIAFKDVEVTRAVHKGSNLLLDGVFPNILVDAANINVNIESGTVSKLELSKNAAGTTVNVAENTEVDTMKLNAPSQIKGNGVVHSVEINSEGVELNVKTGNTVLTSANNPQDKSNGNARTTQITVTNKNEISISPAEAANTGDSKPTPGPTPGETQNTKLPEQTSIAQFTPDNNTRSDNTAISDASKKTGNSISVNGASDSNININNNNIDKSLNNSNNTTNNVDSSLEITNEINKNISPGKNSVTVTIKDKTFETYIRMALGKFSGNITSDDMLQIESLSLANKGIRDISGIEYMKNLKKLNLSGNLLTDVTPLTSLKLLEALYLDKNSISDYSVLKVIYANLKYKDFVISEN